MHPDLSDGDIIRQVKAIRQWRLNNPRAFPRYGCQMLALRIEADRRGLDIDDPESALTPDDLHEKAGSMIRKAISQPYRNSEWIKTGLEVGRLRALAAALKARGIGVDPVGL